MLSINIHTNHVCQHSLLYFQRFSVLFPIKESFHYFLSQRHQLVFFFIHEIWASSIEIDTIQKVNKYAPFEVLATYKFTGDHKKEESTFHFYLKSCSMSIHSY